MNSSFLDFPWDFDRDWREEFSPKALAPRLKAFLAHPPPESELASLPSRERAALRSERRSYIWNNILLLSAFSFLVLGVGLIFYSFWITLLAGAFATLLFLVLMVRDFPPAAASFPYFARPVEATWRPVQQEVRRLLLAADDYKRCLEGRSPEEDGRKRPAYYQERAEEIEATYHDPRNPVSTPGRRSWIANLAVERMASEVHLASQPTGQLTALLQLYWEGDHLALLAARLVEPASPPPGPLSPVAIARQHLEHARGLDELFKEEEDRFERELAERLEKKRAAGESDKEIERARQTGRARHADDMRNLMRDVQAEIARLRKEQAPS